MKQILLLLVILLKIIVFSQNKFSINELKTLSTPINLTSSSEYTEFEFLKTKIDTSLPIFLGESSHTISDYNRLRVKMIKYLHETLNYNVIAFEAPFANLKYVSENRNTLTSEKMLKMSLFYTWKTEDLLELMNYLKNHPMLKIMGFDCQERNIDSLVIKNYYSKIEMNNRQLANNYMYMIEKFRQSMKNNPFTKFETFKNESQKVIILIDSLKEMLSKNNLTDFDIHFHLSNLKNNCINYNMYLPDFSKSNHFRDSIMAENYLSLTNSLFPNEKVILWGHNAHLSKQSLDEEYPVSMGEFLHKKINYNSIGLFAYSGTYGYGTYGEQIKKIRKPSKKFIEYYLNKNNLEISYINLKNLHTNSWLKNKYQILDTKHGVMKTIPSNCFDGIIFFKHVSESNYLNNI